MGKDNDNSVFTFVRCVPTINGYERYVSYIEHCNGLHTTKQAIILKRLFYDLECDYVAMDTQGKQLPLIMVT